MVKMEKKYIGLSKYLSYILRHDPDRADLDPDEKGFVSLDKVLDSLVDTKHSWASKDDIEYLIEKSEKRRFEIKGDRIRALYGHSYRIEIEEKIKPLEFLYHGTSPDSLGPIFKDGLKPMEREYVHLSKSVKEARKVGKRHHPKPQILKIEALDAHKDGLEFYDRGDVILSEAVPPKYISEGINRGIQIRCTR